MNAATFAQIPPTTTEYYGDHNHRMHFIIVGDGVEPNNLETSYHWSQRSELKPNQ